MPISNPIVNLITNPATPPPPPVVLLESTDPLVAPIRDRTFWLNLSTNKLWLAVATNLLSDWIAVGGDSVGAANWDAIANKPDTFPSTWLSVSNKPDTFPVDVANILNKILVQNGEVLTTDQHVIFED